MFQAELAHVGRSSCDNLMRFVRESSLGEGLDPEGIELVDSIGFDVLILVFLDR